MADNTKPTKKVKKDQEKVAQPLIAANTIIKLTIPSAEAQAAYDKALNKLAKKVNVAGFRKGKVPAKVAQENLKPETIIEEALQIVIPELYTKEIQKSGHQPLTYPEFNPVSLNQGEDWIVEAHIAQRPQITLTGYEKIVVTAKKDAIKEIEQQTKAAEKHAQECKDEKHQHGSEQPSEAEKNDFILQYIYKELVANIKPQIQELLVKEEARYDLENLAKQLKQFNIPFEKFLEQRKLTFEQLSSELAAGALARLQTAFIIDEVAKTAKLTVEQADLDAAFSKVTDEKLKAQQKSDPRYLEMMSQTILRQKVAAHLVALQ